MAMLHAGLALWFVVHAFPSVAPARRSALQQSLGEKPYRGVFSLLILAALLLIVFGWKSAIPFAIYVPPLGPGLLSSALVLGALILFFSSRVNGHIKRVLRHPQMAGTTLWAVSHLLTNGDSRSVALFGTMAVWAVFEIIMINRREGARSGAAAASGKFDLIAIVIGAVVFAVVGHFHLALFGVAPIAA
jgi:uncharacterized membrane protein